MTHAPGDLSVSSTVTKADWLRLLRHMPPHKLRALLLEHDLFEHMQSEVQRLRDEVCYEQQRVLTQKNALDDMESEVQHLREEIRQERQQRIAQQAVLTRMHSQIQRSLLLQGRLAAHMLGDGSALSNLAAAEFGVSSQWGEDGIIEWLVSRVAVPNNHFVEFGVESFSEANCRFLLQNRNWKGLIFDSSEDNMARLRRESMFWMHDLTAKAAFITAENINELIAEAGFSGPLGILSIDIDGNDYWVWKAIEVVDPAIVICEYNALFGDNHAITVPYNPEFHRFLGHCSGLYYGASLAALKLLAEQKGYVFVGTNSNGVNAFFIKKSLSALVLEQLEGIRAFCSRHRDSRNQDAELSFVGGRARLDLISHCPVVDVTSGATLRLEEIADLYSPEWLRDMD